MRSLLSAGMVRLWRCKALWISCAATAGYEIFSVLSRGLKGGEGRQIVYNLDGGFFQFSGMIVLVSALICAFLIGPEHGDGTMRNKLVTGHSRRDIYLSNLLLSALASLTACLAAILPGLALGLPLLGGFEMGAARACRMVLGICALSVAYAGIFTAVTMLIANRAVSLTSAVILALGLLAAGAYLNGRLTAPPTLQGYSLSVNGQLMAAVPTPNPAYLPESPVRAVFQFLYDFLPGGQTGQYITVSAQCPELLMVYDVVILAAVTAAGLILFRRKDLK